MGDPVHHRCATGGHYLAVEDLEYFQEIVEDDIAFEFLIFLVP